jgi:hypothetical protein
VAQLNKSRRAFTEDELATGKLKQFAISQTNSDYCSPRYRSHVEASPPHPDVSVNGAMEAVICYMRL